MKEKYKNLEKVIFFILLCFLLVFMLVLLKGGIAGNDILEEKIQRISTQSSKYPSGVRDDNKAQEYLMSEDKTERLFSTVTSKRNIFTQKVYENTEIVSSDSLVLQVIEIGLKPLGIEYQGRVSFEDDIDMVAQVNVHKKSYLVKKGTKFAAYNVHELNGEFIELKDKKGKIIKIKYRKIAYTNELVAKIKELTSSYSETVNKNGTFLAYKVLDIDEDSVLLSLRGQQLRLEKGMVHK
ncbi:MAG: hypothetical protein KAS13_06650 [Candidatus Omnitrophica bacterium]|nr:hypothetical protein [Candidatus Omnitrophota bacterium]